MKKYSFKNDYSEGAHPDILTKLVAVNLEQNIGYGEDVYTNQAKEFIKTACSNQDAAVHFVSGGTQANLIVISALLKPYESVIAAETGHVAVHETGAIESTGHKINTVKTKNGKLSPNDILAVLTVHEDEHMVKPKLVYISNSTELGTIYSKQELEAIAKTCKANDLLLFMDGARLGAALTAKTNDLTLAIISKLTDVFYIGGTKNGALLGEAIVINYPALQENFRFSLKQRGALLAKGRLLGIQFLTLFTDDLFFELAKQANHTAELLANELAVLGYDFYYEAVSNQLFLVLPNELIAELAKSYDFHIWEVVDETHSVIRLVTSWATTTEQIDGFVERLRC